MPGADILGISLLKLPRGLAFEIPARVEHLVNRLTDFSIVEVVDSFQIQILNHRSYS